MSTIIHVLTSVDTQSILAGNNSSVVYMVDDNANKGSSSEGTTELKTTCAPGDIINWRVTPINGTDTVVITSMFNSSGDIFATPPSEQPDGSWQGTVSSTGNETYQMQILINGVKTFKWDPYLVSS